MIICPTEKTVIATAPKTGSTSLHAMAHRHAPDERSRPFIVRVDTPHGQHDCGLPECVKDDRDAWQVIVTIRNPFTRIVSLWRHQQATEFASTFRMFVDRVAEKIAPEIYSRTLVDWYSECGVDGVIRFESFEADVVALQLFRCDVAHENASRAVRDPHDDVTREKTGLWARDDFNLIYGT